MCGNLDNGLFSLFFFASFFEHGFDLGKSGAFFTQIIVVNPPLDFLCDAAPLAFPSKAQRNRSDFFLLWSFSRGVYPSL